MDALIVVFVTGLISMFIAMAKKPSSVLGTAVVGLSVAIGLMVNQWFNPSNFVKYEGLEFTEAAILFSVLAMSFTLLIIVGGYSYFKREVEHTGEYISLLIFSLVGALCMLSFTDLFMFFLGLEILSIPIYVMAGSKKKDELSSEASLKYFFTGAFSTGVLLFGIAWVYGATGSFKLDEIEAAISSGAASGPLLHIGILMMMASFLFKVGAAPFHFWSPDVYSGSPNIVTGYMAAVVKLAGLFAFMNLFSSVFSGAHEVWSGALFGLIILTIFVGNLTALRQTKFKRLLAYSSIANAGYALLAIIVQGNENLNFWNLWIYLLGYGFSIIALIVISLILDNESDDISAYKGIGRKNPFIGVIMALGLLSLAGVPPLAGFFGKFMVFSNAFNDYPVLVILAVVNSGIGIYYYLRMLITVMSIEENEEVKTLTPSLMQYAVLVVCAVALIIGGFITI
jgi:NADH-quinone oxidoreductase subunit N